MERRPRKMPRYVQALIDRSGQARHYYRRSGYRVPLPGLPWSPEFMATYEKADKEWNAGKTSYTSTVGAGRFKPGSMDALIASYYASTDFTNLKPITQSTYRNELERFRRDHGFRMVADLQREHIKTLMAKRADRPSAANQLLKVLRVLIRHAMDIGWRKDDPATGIKKYKTSSGGYRTWTEADIEVFANRHPAGSRARLALDLLVYTGARRADVVAMGRQHLSAGLLVMRQSKTGTEVAIPVHPDLAESLARVPKDRPTFLATEFGKPFTPAGFANWFRERIREAGLPSGLSPHGLRKAACRRLAEAGCTPSEIMAFSGHKSLSEVTRYTEAADRARMAGKAVASLQPRPKEDEK